MLRSRIDISQGLDRGPTRLGASVAAEEELAASAYAVAATATERVRTAGMSVYEALEFREATALADVLAYRGGQSSLALSSPRAQSARSALLPRTIQRFTAV